MPLKLGSSQATISSNIRELHGGNTYSRTAAKFGKARANKQAVVIAMNKAGKKRMPMGVSDMARRTLAAGAKMHPMRAKIAKVMRTIAHGSR